MGNQFQETLQYYSQNTREYAERTNIIDISALYPPFKSLLSSGSTLLDLGCGAGRDARYFAKEGHSVIAIDPCQELLTEAKYRTPLELGRRIWYVAGEVPGLPLFDGCCDGIPQLKEAELEYAEIHLPKDFIILESY
ncbi:MAG: class I SAM-dependent methyltransferase [Planctomycetota bacterium]|jgi:2-polyprenyl-3-methyl-5-hydroxy-6-metoxy-1,4-benzoquinol methylase